MTVFPQEVEFGDLVLAAEDFSPDEFKKFHKFSRNDERVLSKLIAHGPVLLQGGRGSGKSALMIEAGQRLKLGDDKAPALGVYLSLRHMPLLRSEGREYERIFCSLIVDQIKRLLQDSGHSFQAEPDLQSVQYAISDLSQAVGKRIVLLFDDAAHIGREASLADFFDIFRTLSSSTVSCKATIYPGVTNFGTRFDVYNDATVVDLVRDEDQPGFAELFKEVLQVRRPQLLDRPFSSDLKQDDFAKFLGMSVLGNMRAFIFACNALMESQERSIGLPTIGQMFLDLTTNYYWPLIEEVRPKLGKYVPLVEPASEIATILFAECGKSFKNSALIHRDLISKGAKAFEILEYSGFIAKRESSRSMKSGGRGSRFALNLCMLLENVEGKRLTRSLFNDWLKGVEEPAEFHVKGSAFAAVAIPSPDEKAEMDILKEPVDVLLRSQAYPYGLTERRIELLREAGISTVKELAETPDDVLDDIPMTGGATIRKIKNAVLHAIWL